MTFLWIIKKRNHAFLLLHCLILCCCENTQKNSIQESKKGNVRYIYQKDKSSNLEKFVGYYPNGKIASEGFLKGDSLTGVFKNYDSTGKILFIQNYKYDLKEGNSYYYYPNGNIHKVISYSKNLKSGDYIEFYEQDSSKMKILIKYVIVRGKSHENESTKFALDGSVIERSSHLVFYTDINGETVLTLKNPEFDKMRVFIGNYDKEYYLKDSLSLITLTPSKDSSVKLPHFSSKTTIRGVVEDYKIVEQHDDGSYKTLSKDIFFEYVY